MNRTRSSASGSPDRRDRAAVAAVGPIRTCIGCRARRSPGLMVRVVASEEPPGFRFGTGVHGRGAWLCRADREPGGTHAEVTTVPGSDAVTLANALGVDPRCVATALKRSAAARAFRRPRSGQ